MAFDPETANPDLVIRGGTVADGRGGDLFEADVAIKDGRIAEIGKVLGKGTEEIDARGKLVTPGFVDVHTHYDGQVTWSQDITPSSQNGVTTAIMGNCGVGFAPCRPDDHFRLIQLMEGVEDIPEPVLSAGIPWSWESFPDYMDWLSKRNFDIDIGAQLPHAALRVYVMGERGARRDPSTQEDNKAMAALAREAVRSGALGFSTSRTLNHRTSTGDFTPTLKAGEDELTAIAEAMHGQGRSVLQFVLDLSSLDEDLPMMLRVAENTGAQSPSPSPRMTRRRGAGARRSTRSMLLPRAGCRSRRKSQRARSGCCSALNCRATRSRPIRATGRSPSCRLKSG